MDFLWDKITEWLKEMLIGGIVSNLSGMFDATNQKVAEISGQVGLSPQAWNGSIFSMIQNLSETVIVPIAGAILAFVMTLELIQLITDKNNLNDMDTWIFFKWAFKSAAAVLIVTNTWTIVMGVFDAAQSVVASASGLIIGDTSINISSVMVGIEDRLMEMELGPLFGLWFQSLFVGITMWALTICIFIITFGRMIEIYRHLCCPNSDGDHDGQGMGRHGTELHPFPAGAGLPSISHHRLRCHLRRSGAEHRACG